MEFFLVLFLLLIIQKKVKKEEVLGFVTVFPFEEIKRKKEQKIREFNSFQFNSFILIKKGSLDQLPSDGQQLFQIGMPILTPF